MNFPEIQHLHIDWSELFKFLLRPVLTLFIWYVVDRVLRRLHHQSNCIGSVLEQYFLRNASNDTRKHVIEQRVRTFRGLFFQMLRILVGVFFLFILMDNLRIDIKPLLAGIGVVGLGLSLAAQNILRDFINGLFIVIEDQYNIGDTVEIGSYSGTVESFSMRTTKLRSADGKWVLIPNGTISQVVNSNKEFSVSMIDIGVSYDTDVRRAMSVLQDCANEIQGQFKSVIIDKPGVQGIMDFRDSDIVLRVTTKTLAGEHWALGRALRICIKERFDREGIQIPYPQRVVHLADDSLMTLKNAGDAKQENTLSEAGRKDDAAADEKEPEEKP